MDVNLSDRHRLFGFFAGGNYATNFTGSLNQTGAAGVLPEPYTQGRIVEESVKMAQMHDTFTISAHALNQFSYVLQPDLDSPAESHRGGSYPQKAGFKGLPPSVVAADVSRTSISPAPIRPGGWQGTNAHFFNEAANTFTAQNNVMWVKGRHSMVLRFPVPGAAGQRELRR